MNDSLSAINLEKLNATVSDIDGTEETAPHSTPVSVSTRVAVSTSHLIPIAPLPASFSNTGPSLPTILPSSIPFFLTVTPNIEIFSQNRGHKDRHNLFAGERYQTSQLDASRIAPLLTVPPLPFSLPFQSQCDHHSSHVHSTAGVPSFNLPFPPPHHLIPPSVMPALPCQTLPHINTIAVPTITVSSVSDNVTTTYRNTPCSVPMTSSSLNVVACSNVTMAPSVESIPSPSTPLHVDHHSVISPGSDNLVTAIEHMSSLAETPQKQSDHVDSHDTQLHSIVDLLNQINTPSKPHSNVMSSLGSQQHTEHHIHVDSHGDQSSGQQHALTSHHYSGVYPHTLQDGCRTLLPMHQYESHSISTCSDQTVDIGHPYPTCILPSHQRLPDNNSTQYTHDSQMGNDSRGNINYQEQLYQTQLKLDYALQVLAQHAQTAKSTEGYQNDGSLHVINWSSIAASTEENCVNDSQEANDKRPASEESTGEPEQSTSSHMYCVDCNTTYKGHCKVHTEPYEVIKDLALPTLARATLPHQLQLKTSLIRSKLPGVFSRDVIKNRTIFGPLVGEIFEADYLTKTDLDQTKIWPLYSNGKCQSVIGCRDENKCNWFMFVRCASLSLEQNLVVFQQDGGIYFVSRCDIQPGMELLYWYSKDYSSLRGFEVCPEGSVTCSVCNKQFLNVQTTNEHMKQAHVTTDDNSRKMFKCSQCDKGFCSQSKLKAHALIHSTVKPYSCEICKKTFSDTSNLKVHHKIHTGEKKFSCKYCSKSFRQKAHMQSHMSVHTGEKKGKCLYCGKLFSHLGDLRNHINSHTKEKVFTCEFCHREFYKLQNYQKHINVHKGIKNFECGNCKKRFPTSFHLNRHNLSCDKSKTQDDKPINLKSYRNRNILDVQSNGT